MKFFKTKTFIRLVAVTILSAITVASMSVSAFAAEPINAAAAIDTIESTEITANQNPEITIDGIGGIMPFSNRTLSLGSNSSYQRITVSFPMSGGFFSVFVEDFVPADYQMDIMMWGNDDDGLLWEEFDCLGSSNNRVFSCGHNVKAISIRIIPRNRLLFPAPARAFSTYVSW